MNLADVMDGIGSALDTISGLGVYPYAEPNIYPPCAVVLWPDRIDYDAAMVRGGDRITLPVLICVGDVDSPSGRDDLAKYLDGSGPYSVKAAVESFASDSYDSARVQFVEPIAVPSGGVNYLGAQFTIDIIGRGA